MNRLKNIEWNMYVYKNNNQAGMGMNLQEISWKSVKMDKYVSKHPENQQNGAQNFLKSGNFLKILMPDQGMVGSSCLQKLCVIHLFIVCKSICLQTGME